MEKKDYTERWVREKFKALKRALKLQSKEYERRLTELNNEAGRLKSMKDELTNKEVFDRTVNQLRIEIEELKTYKTKQEGRSALIQYIPWIGIAASLVLAYLSYIKK